MVMNEDHKRVWHWFILHRSHKTLFLHLNDTWMKQHTEFLLCWTHLSNKSPRIILLFVRVKVIIVVKCISMRGNVDIWSFLFFSFLYFVASEYFSFQFKNLFINSTKCKYLQVMKCLPHFQWSYYCGKIDWLIYLMIILWIK